MALLNAGWFQTTWFPSGWWQEDWWQDYGLAEVQSIYTKMDSKAYLAAGTAAVDFIAAEITAKAHIIATISAKEET
ncbi:MAG: hypothetical protein HY887_07735 [Deltaproteobacteria bacterium]|nr:hypothetical protein [Deltaproteobacteria bacterium]